jgi:hypothetical protein
MSHESKKRIVGKLYPIGSEYRFGGRAFANVCTLIQIIIGVETFGEDEPAYIAVKEPPPIINLTVDCEKLSGHTGNWIYIRGCKLLLYIQYNNVTYIVNMEARQEVGVLSFPCI